jgi:hypothetical protein
MVFTQSTMMVVEIIIQEQFIVLDELEEVYYARRSL